MIDLIIFISVLFIAFFFGQWGEKRHYKSIREREEKLAHIPVITQGWKKTAPKLDREVGKSGLVTGQVVMGVDSFRTFLGGILSLFGGRIKPYESMIDRARREAILRAKEKAVKADMFLNVRVETSIIKKGAVEVVAYTTAIRFK
jgi:uncharacterized protein YbjQ (UPF0145 family)